MSLEIGKLVSNPEEGPELRLSLLVAQKFPNTTDVVLVATRMGAVLDRVDLSDEDYIEPESFQRGLYPHWGILRRMRNKEVFKGKEVKIWQIE